MCSWSVCALHGGGQVAAQGLARGDHRQRRVLGDLVGQPQGGGAQLVQPATTSSTRPQASASSAFTRRPVRNIRLRPLLADQARQGVGQAEARMEAQLHEVGGEPRLGRGDPEVGHQRQAQARADRRALHRRHDRLLDREQPHRLVVERR